MTGAGERVRAPAGGGVGAGAPEAGPPRFLPEKTIGRCA